MGDRHLSRREVLEAIPLVGRGSLLVGLVSHGARAAAANGILRGKLKDGVSGKLVAAKMRVTDAATGEPYMPAGSVKSMPKKSLSGVRYFYAREQYEVALPAGRYQVEVVRGIGQEAEMAAVEVAAGSTEVRDFQFRPVRDLHGGWYSGNTHTHYNVDIRALPVREHSAAGGAGIDGQLSVSGTAPDFPTLSMLCAEARRIGGTCHLVP